MDAETAALTIYATGLSINPIIASISAIAGAAVAKNVSSGNKSFFFVWILAAPAIYLALNFFLSMLPWLVIVAVVAAVLVLLLKASSSAEPPII